MSTKRLPDFVIIGAGKSGTTSLNEYLKEHPSIFMATRKEPNFFAFETLDPSIYDEEKSIEYYYNSVLTIDDYYKLFEGAKEEQLLGEVSNTYISHDHSWERIKHYVPNAKLIAILRHPAERLYSRYFHLVRENEIPEGGEMEEVFNRDSVWWRRPDLVNEGFYYEKLKPFYDNFPKENIKIFLYEEFIGDTDRVLRDTFNFLGIDPEVKVATDIIYNKSGEVKNKSVDALVGQNSGLILFLKKFLPGLHRYLKESVWANRILNNMRNKNLDKPGMDPDFRKRITHDLYKEDIEKLAELLGRDMSAWL